MSRKARLHWATRMKGELHQAREYALALEASKDTFPEYASIVLHPDDKIVEVITSDEILCIPPQSGGSQIFQGILSDFDPSWAGSEFPSGFSGVDETGFLLSLGVEEVTPHPTWTELGTASGETHLDLPLIIPGFAESMAGWTPDKRRAKSQFIKHVVRGLRRAHRLAWVIRGVSRGGYLVGLCLSYSGQIQQIAEVRDRLDAVAADASATFSALIGEQESS